jgi:hypothetical protein
VTFTPRLLSEVETRARSVDEVTKSVPVEALLEGARVLAEIELEELIRQAGMPLGEVSESIAAIRWGSAWEVWLPAGENFGQVVIAAQLCDGVWEQLPAAVQQIFADPDGDEGPSACIFREKIDDVVRWKYVCGVMSGHEVKITEEDGTFHVDLAAA